VQEEEVVVVAETARYTIQVGRYALGTPGDPECVEAIAGYAHLRTKREGQHAIRFRQVGTLSAHREIQIASRPLLDMPILERKEKESFLRTPANMLKFRFSSTMISISLRGLFPATAFFPIPLFPA
jgi:hypothetical protein